MTCPKCGFDNPEGAKYCNECGSKLEIACPECGKVNPLGSKFCNECGHDLREPPKPSPINYSEPQSYTPKFLADKILTTRSSIEGERKLVTVFFADVAGYTSMSEKLDPEEVHQIMDGAFKIMMDEIHKYEGTINQFTGDGIMALFGAPLAHEDHAQRACRAALSIQEAIGSYSEKTKKGYGVEFKMRVGLNSGPVFVGSIGDDLRMDYTAVGDTTNLAARIQQIAMPGEVWISKNTHNSVRDYIQDEPAGELPLKGKAKPQNLYRAISERIGIRTRFEAGLVRGVTALVGRRTEMASLRAAFERAESGEAQVVDVVGEAGVGKSRLVFEFKKNLHGNVKFLPGICQHYGKNINFLPVIDVVKAAFEIEEGMNEKNAGTKIDDKATAELASMIPFYRNLLSLKVDDPNFNALTPDGRKFGTFEAVKSLLFSLSKEKPLIVFLEDVHWMDNISKEFFAYFSRSFLDHPILMLAAYRPEGAPPWAQGAHHQRLGLETLSADFSIRLMRNILGGPALEPNLEQKIVEKAGGNPFFVEEIVRELLDRGDLEKVGDQYNCSRAIDQLEIPNTIQGVLAARIDRLSGDLKRTIQVASVIGRDFAFRILKSIIELGDDLRSRLNDLVGLEILYEKVLFPELEYIFKHALTQEVAYESLLKQRRREIHGRIARAIEELYADRLEENYELLAHHYEQSGDGEKAVEYLILAGEKSNKNKAAQDACLFFKKAHEVAKSAHISLDPETELRIHQGQAASSHEIGDIDTALAGYRRAIEICRKEGKLDIEMDNLAELAWTLWFTPIKTMKDEVIRFCEEGITRAREAGDKAVESRILSVKGFYMSILGHRYQGNRIIADAGRIALETGNQRAIFFTRFQHATSERWLGRPEKTIELTEGLVEALLSAFNLANSFAIIFIRGLALAEFGRIEDSIAILRDGIDICEKVGAGLHLGRLYNGLGYCYHEIHQSERAWSLNLRSEEVARRQMELYPMSRSTTGEVVAQANVNLMENLLDQGKVDEAWHLIESFREESKRDDYDRARDRWEVRMDYLASQILLHRNEIGPAEDLIQKNLDLTRSERSRKMEGSFLRLLGEVSSRRDEIDRAVNCLNEAILVLQKVGNPRQLWQAHANLASALEKPGRVSEAKAHWGAAAAVIDKTATGLSDRQLKEGFLKAEPIREILAKAEV
jgi:class 3 adenylate cyclase/tetratricopeptide (TPR) repeat protein